MEIPSYILFLLGCLGATDIALYYSVAHGIRSHADSVGELVTHSLRGPTHAALFLLVPNFELHGLFAWGLMALFVFGVGISIWDFSLEQDSRRFLGGLPSGEYVLHMLMAITASPMSRCIFSIVSAHAMSGHRRRFSNSARHSTVPTVPRADSSTTTAEPGDDNRARATGRTAGRNQQICPAPYFAGGLPQPGGG